MARRHPLFATCAPGLEPVLHGEARKLGLARVERQVGGVYFEGSWRDVWRTNLCFRTAIRILLRLGRFEARDGDQLYRAVRAIDWSRYLTPDSTLAVSAQTRESALDHSLFVAQRTKDAMVDAIRQRWGARPAVDRESPDLSVHAHLWRDRLTISLDTSGDSLHKRGWRRFQGRATLAETLAAAVVVLSEWDGRSPFIDPFCGSGTLLVEAALLAGQVPPGIFRPRFGFEHLPGHDHEGWESLKKTLRERTAFPPKLILRGVDRDAAMVSGTLENFAAAGIPSDRFRIEAGDAVATEFRRGWNGWIVTNPPYGERVGTPATLERVYREFGALVRSRYGGYHLALLCGNERLAGCLDVPIEERVRLKNGALDCELLKLHVPRKSEGSGDGSGASRARFIHEPRDEKP